MPFNDLNQLTAVHKPWDHVGNILPDIGVSKGESPAVEFKPASWLPVQFRDKYYEVYYVVMPGKAVALDPDGRVMPAQYGLTGASVVYVQADVDNGVIDIATGQAVTTAKTVVLNTLTGQRGATWTLALAGTAGVTSGFMGRFGGDQGATATSFRDATRKAAIGVAPYGYFQWAGGDGSNPAELRQHNHMLQHQVAVLCDYVIRLPYVPAADLLEGIGAAFSGAALVIGAPGLAPAAWCTRANAIANVFGRYNSTTGTVPVLTTYPVIAVVLDSFPVAVNTPRTPITMQSANAADDVSDVLVNERTALSAVTAAGDYFVDYTAGTIFVYSVNGATIPASVTAATGNVSVSYFNYEATSAGGTLSRFATVCGAALVPGDLVEAGANSNLIQTAQTGMDRVLGQVLAIVDDYDEALAKVRTAFSPALGTDSSGSMAAGVAGTAALNLGQLDQMPGSATGGYGDMTTYAGAVRYAIINLISR